MLMCRHGDQTYPMTWSPEESDSVKCRGVTDNIPVLQHGCRDMTGPEPGFTSWFRLILLNPNHDAPSGVLYHRVDGCCDVVLSA